MHDIKWIRDEPAGLIDALARRGGRTPDAVSAATTLVDGLLARDAARRETLTRLESLEVEDGKVVVTPRPPE